MFVGHIWCLYLVNRLLYGVLPETTFFDKNGRTWPQFDLYNFWPWVTSGKFFQMMRRIDARRGTENFKALFPAEFEPNLSYWRKTTRGPFAPPPPSGRGLTIKTIGKKYYTQKRMGYITDISDFWDFENCESLETFIFYFPNNPLKFPIFQKKNGIHVLQEPLKNVYTKFQVIPFINVVL